MICDPQGSALQILVPAATDYVWHRSTKKGRLALDDDDDDDAIVLLPAAFDSASAMADHPAQGDNRIPPFADVFEPGESFSSYYEPEPEISPLALDDPVDQHGDASSNVALRTSTRTFPTSQGGHPRPEARAAPRGEKKLPATFPQRVRIRFLRRGHDGMPPASHLNADDGHSGRCIEQ